MSTSYPSNKITPPRNMHITLPNNSFPNIIGNNLVLKLSFYPLKRSMIYYIQILNTTSFCMYIYEHRY